MNFADFATYSPFACCRQTTFAWSCNMAVLQVADTVKQLKMLSLNIAACERHNEVEFLERTLTDDFVGIVRRKTILTKSIWIQCFVTGTLEYGHYAWDEIAVQFQGVTARVIVPEHSTAGLPAVFVRRLVPLTLVYVKQGRGWLLWRAFN
jgi:hypothetical protein